MKYLLLFSIALFVSCSDASIQEELTKVKSDLETSLKTLAEVQANTEPEGNLVHFVFFKLKPDIDQTMLVKEIKKLEKIEGVMDFQVGPFEDLKDVRALSDYSMVMEMSFENKAAYQKYQKNPIHLALKENLKAFLAAPPATYDYLKK